MGEENPEVKNQKYERAFQLSALLFLLGGIIFYFQAASFKSHMLVFGIAAALIMALSSFRIAARRDKSVEALGEAIVQGGWIWTSLSLVYILMSPARIYGLGSAGVAALVALGALLLVAGVYVMLRASRETGVKLTI